MDNTKHYFDWAATAPIDRDIQSEAFNFSIEHWANPSSLHRPGEDARRALEETRENIAQYLGIKPKEVFFTSGGTESNHIPLLSMLNRPQKGSIAISAIEHPSVREMAKEVEHCGFKLLLIEPDKNGIVQVESVLKTIQKDTVYVSIMAVNNETGAIQPIKQIADALDNLKTTSRKPFFHVDCVQAAGKIPLELSYKGIDAASISAHKLGGPRGCGLLYLKKEITPFLKGGGQEMGVRSGTENLFGAKALELCIKKYYLYEDNKIAQDRLKTQTEYTDIFIKKLKEIKNFRLIPQKRSEDNYSALYSPWIVQGAIIGTPGQVMQRALSEKGFYISTGSACSSGRHAHPVLDSMHIAPEEKESAVRFSFGHESTLEEMLLLSNAIKEVSESL